ncbi:MAG: glycosyltransferase involved in cell wall biosynthesis [Myxococcota bacterium]
MRAPKHRLGGVRDLVRFAQFAARTCLQFRDYDIWHCNDIEAYVIGLVAKLMRPELQLVYDCHEFESERQGKSALYSRAVAMLEGLFIGQAGAVLTVSPSIADAYDQRYGVRPSLARNVPHARPDVSGDRFREAFPIGKDETIFLYQGAMTGGRGIEDTIEAFVGLADQGIHLVLMGFGPMQAYVEQHTASHSNMHVHPAVSYENVLEYSASADIGLMTAAPTCLSYLYCLPNKLFEYIQAGIPILCNDLPDCRALIEQYSMGEIVPDTSPQSWRQAVRRMADTVLSSYDRGLRQARADLHWDREEQALLGAYANLSPVPEQPTAAWTPQVRKAARH